MIKLILPIVFPSWRFFSGIGASPRIEFAFLHSEISEPKVWQEFRPRPARLSFAQGLRRLLWNPEWNEFLYMNTCAEHICDEHSVMREQEIMRRILLAASAGEIKSEPDAHFLLFRISTVVREDKVVKRSVVFVSKPVAVVVPVAFVGGAA
ncbi:MAG: hypothetical protein V4660_19420 [Pseudomonadota bacterium]